MIPYRFHQDTAHTTYAGSREYIAEVLEKMSNEYMNGCIRFVDDTEAKGKSFKIIGDSNNFPGRYGMQVKNNNTRDFYHQSQ